MSFLYEDGEMDRIRKIKETNDRMETFFDGERQKWNDSIEPLIIAAKCKYDRDTAQSIVDLQASALAFRQNLNEQVSMFLQKRSKEKQKEKTAKHEKIVWYALGKSPLGLDRKLSNAHMTDIIDSHVSEVQRGVELIEVHIEFLRTSAKTLNDLAFQVKNTIELYNLLSRN